MPCQFVVGTSTALVSTGGPAWRISDASTHRWCSLPVAQNQHRAWHEQMLRPGSCRLLAVKVRVIPSTPLNAKDLNKNEDLQVASDNAGFFRRFRG